MLISTYERTVKEYLKKGTKMNVAYANGGVMKYVVFIRSCESSFLEG